MENFEVDGRTLVDWTMRVQAHNEAEALEEAQRIATRVDMWSRLATVNLAHPRVVRCRVTDSAAE